MATAMIGNDILDIGTRKARRQRGDAMSPAMLTMGTPGQFELPNVPDVRIVLPSVLFRSHDFKLNLR